jgi:hypothetical protein
MTKRYFRSVNHLTLPSTIHTGAGATHTRLAPGDVIDLCPKKCAAESRFINGRVRGGDLVEVDAAEFEMFTKAAEAVQATDTAPATKPAKGK